MIKIKDSKNVIKDSTISASGNIHIGDKVTNVYQNQPLNEEVKEEKKATNEVATKAKNLIAKSKVSQAIDLLENSIDKEEDLYNELVQQAQKWNKLKKEERLMIINSSESNLRNNQIVNGLLGVITELKKMD